MNTTIHTTNETSAQLSLFPTSSVQEETALNTVYQYFFIINLPSTVSQSIKQFKLRLNKSVGLSDYNLYATPNITLMSFHTMRPVNQYFLDTIQSLLLKIPHFNISINGFDYFEHGNTSNTLYAKVEDSEFLHYLYKELHELLKLKVRSFVPHLTIARTIPRSKFNKAFSLFEDKKFKEQFTCQQISILQRTIEFGTASKFSVLKEFELKNPYTLKLVA